MVSVEALATDLLRSPIAASLEHPWCRRQVEEGVFFVELWLAPPGIIKVDFVQHFEVVVFGFICHVTLAWRVPDCTAYGKPRAPDFADCV